MSNGVAQDMPFPVSICSARFSTWVSCAFSQPRDTCTICTLYKHMQMKMNYSDHPPRLALKTTFSEYVFFGAAPAVFAKLSKSRTDPLSL